MDSQPSCACAATSTPEEPVRATPPPTPFAGGAIVAGSYQIRRVLGAGGMGTVYEAHDLALNRSVALKVAHRRSESLKREAQALAAIRHPSMVGVHALGVHEGVEFLVMELVRGRTLYDVMRAQAAAGRPFAVGEALDTLLGIAEGLGAIHASGISHRDVKPANIMLATGGRTVLMDFGLFKPEFERLDAIAGSPEYMAPEVCLGRVEPGRGHLVDLYALGIIAWELLVGVPPLHGGDVMETVRMQVQTAVPPLGARRPDVPPPLAALVGELTAKLPSDRPASSEEVVGRLRAIRRHREHADADERLSVLIVDDDRELGETLRALVREAAPGAQVEVARDGETALRYLGRRTPSLVLLDLAMPRMNGLELCMTLRGAGIGEGCRIIAMSGSELRPRDRELLSILEVAAFFPKTPSLPRAILGVIAELKRRRVH